MSNDNEVKFKKKKNKKNALGYLYLFAFVFVSALAFMSYLVKSYSPNVDVEIGNKEDLTLSEADMNMEIKSIDERLKWIQEEDEMPSVALRENKSKKYEDKIVDTPNEETEKQNAVIPLPEKPKDYNNQTEIQKDFRKADSATEQTKAPAPMPSYTKVYLGNFATIEDAMSVQEKINQEIPDAMPFVKAVNDKYIVQLGSFSKKETADALISRLKAKGYSPKIAEK